MPDPALVLGPLVRYVDETSVTVWVETAQTTTVTVTADGRSWSARTFAVQEHHYALVVVSGLAPGSAHEYEVLVGDRQVWPEPGSPFPPPVLATLTADRPPVFAFGSCRTTAPHDRAGNRAHGVDALRAYALALAAGRTARPDFMAFLGDQVYADETSDAMRAFIEQRRDISQPPGTEIKDFEEYAHLYQLAWAEPANRWLLSTVPSCMIFDDHDIRDDWNTSWSWHEEINATPWWHERLTGGLASYWVYQHLGNLSPAALVEDPVWSRVSAAADDDTTEVDLTDELFALVERDDRNPEAYRWSYARDVGDCRLVVIDSRAGRVLQPDCRSMLDDTDLEWLDGQITGDLDHLFLATSLPFLLPPGLHDIEAISESLARGDKGPRVAALAERVRRNVDLEHWAAFHDSFETVLAMVMDTAGGRRGRPPATITFLSGDVHNSYVAEVETAPGGTRVLQAVCSPIRNPMHRGMRAVMTGFSRSLVRPLRAIAGRARDVPDPPHPWRVTRGPWYDNNLAVLQVAGAGLRLAWYTGEVADGADERPTLRQVRHVALTGSRDPRHTGQETLPNQRESESRVGPQGTTHH